MKQLNQAEVGDAVVVWPSRHNSSAPKILKIKSTTKTSITLEDETRWTRGGRAWGGSTDPWYQGRTISVMQDGDVDRVNSLIMESNRKAMIRFIKESDFACLSYDDIKGIYQSLKQETKQ